VQRRIIEPHQFVADTEAFVDVRIERSRGKASYSFIGPGVSQNSKQSVNLCEAHGFNVGAASMPTGVVNNPHLHYTAEVFVCTRGNFRMTIGRHGEQTIDIGAGDVFVAPTWIFRGFTNIGPDDSWSFVVLGGDETGGIIWSPETLREAAETGMFLAPDNSLIDRAAGQTTEEVIAPVSDEDLASIDAYTDEELAAHLVPSDERQWSERALLSSVLPGHACELAPALGFGMTEDRRHRAPVMTSQGFSVEWLRIQPGQSTGLHRIAETQVLLLAAGEWQIDFNEEVDRVETTPAEGSVVSVPPGTWRNFANVGDIDAYAAVICGTDAPNVIEWSTEITRAADDAGWRRDAANKIAPVALLGHRTTRESTPGGSL